MCGGIYEDEFKDVQPKRKLLVSIWRCGGKLYRSYTDGTVDVVRLEE